jgi:glutamate-1-semialdehyde 2,1-aminomutase
MIADRFARSRAVHERARQTLAGGAASAVRAAQRPVPVSFERAAGARMWDVDGNEYVDYALAYGPMLLGHSPEPVLSAVRRQLDTGIGYGASHRQESELAELVGALVPSAELCVFNSTGTEAVQTALRIARAATGRRRIIKFLGHYHGWVDNIFIASYGQPDSAAPGTGGQDAGAAATVTIAAWQHLAALQDALADDVAAVIMEPIAVNGGCIVPDLAYLRAAAHAVRQTGAVLVFDETVTGFRVSLGGAQQVFGVLPDLTILGKAMGGGFPISAVVGRADVMSVTESGAVTHMGTYNLNPLATSAAVATLRHLEANAASVYPHLERSTAALAGILLEEARKAGLPFQVNYQTGVAHGFVSEQPVRTYAEALQARDADFRAFAEAMLTNGVHIIPKGILYTSAAHTDADLEATRLAARRAMSVLGRLSD